MFNICKKINNKIKINKMKEALEGQLTALSHIKELSYYIDLPVDHYKSISEKIEVLKESLKEYKTLSKCCKDNIKYIRNKEFKNHNFSEEEIYPLVYHIQKMEEDLEFYEAKKNEWEKQLQELESN